MVSQPIHDGLRFSDNELRFALRKYYHLKGIELPKANDARAMINAFAQWLRETDNTHVAISKLPILAHKWLVNIWGIHANGSL